MTQQRPRRSAAVPAFLGGVFSAASTAVLVEIAVDNAHWLPVRAVAGAAAAAVAISSTGAVARRSAERARDARDARLTSPIVRSGSVVDAIPVGVETTRDLSDVHSTETLLDSYPGGRRSGRVRFAVPDTGRTAAYSTYGQLDVDQNDLPRLGQYRTGVSEIEIGDRGVWLDGSDSHRNTPRTPPIPRHRRFVGVDRIRTAAITPVMAFVVGFTGAAYTVHEFLPDTHGISSGIRDALARVGPSSSDEVSGDAEQNLKDSLEYVEALSPGASGRLSYISITPDSDVSIRYYEPNDGKEWQVYAEGDPTEMGNGTSRGTFSLTADQVPPLNTMRDQAFGYFDTPWFMEITPPDDDVLLPANHVAGEPIVEFVSRGTSEEYKTIQGTLDGTLAPFFDTEDIPAAYAALITALQRHGVDPNSAAFNAFGASGPIGGNGYASGGSAPGRVLFAELGPGTGALPAGTFSVTSGAFATFDPDDGAWEPEDLAALIPVTALSPDTVSAVFSQQAAEQQAEKTDLRAHAFMVEAPDPNKEADPAVLKLAFITMSESGREYTLDGAPYVDG